MKNLKHASLIVAIISLIAACAPKQVHPLNPEDQLSEASEILSEALKVLNDTSRNPRSLEENGELRLVRPRDWTSGFFPGILWMMFDYSGDDIWKEAAHHYSMNIEAEKYNGGTHDMGFKMYCSFGNGLRLTGNPQYRDILIQSAQTLMTRYHPNVGCIRSWDHNRDKWD